MQANEAKKTTRKKPNTVVLLIIAALLVLALILLPERNAGEPQYELTIRELGGTSMLAASASEELGYGEILLVYSEDMVVEDVNGQEISYDELGVADKIRVSLLPGEKDAQGNPSEPVISRIILLPGGQDDYV